MIEGDVPSDPGWRPVVRKVLPRLIVPIGFGRSSMAGDDQPPVLVTRAVFLSFAMALVMFLYVLTFIHPWSSDDPVPSSVHLLLVAGLIAPTATRIRRLDESLSAGGCAESLRAALYTPMDAGNVNQPGS